MNLIDQPISEIRGVNVRDQAAVERLAESIKVIGLLNPVTITPNKVLVAGSHRVAACAMVGWETIPALVQETRNPQVELIWRLAHIDENLMRCELTAAERAEQLAERKHIYEQLHPDTTAGAKRAEGMNKALGHNVAASTAATFTEDAAEKTGLAPRTIREDVQIAESLTPETKELVRGTPVENRKRDLLEIARSAPEDQELVARGQ